MYFMPAYVTARLTSTVIMYSQEATDRCISCVAHVEAHWLCIMTQESTAVAFVIEALQLVYFIKCGVLQAGLEHDNESSQFQGCATDEAECCHKARWGTSGAACLRQ